MSSVRQDDVSDRHEGLLRSREEQHRLLVSLNDRVAAAAVRHHFGSERVPFQCECGVEGCETLVPLTLEQYHEVRERGAGVLAPHRGPGR